MFAVSAMVRFSLPPGSCMYFCMLKELGNKIQYVVCAKCNFTLFVSDFYENFEICCYCYTLLLLSRCIILPNSVSFGSHSQTGIAVLRSLLKVSKPLSS